MTNIKPLSEADDAALANALQAPGSAPLDIAADRILDLLISVCDGRDFHDLHDPHSTIQ